MKLPAAKKWQDFLYHGKGESGNFLPNVHGKKEGIKESTQRQYCPHNPM